MRSLKGNRKIKSAALADIRLDPNPTAMPRDDFAADRQADSRSRISVGSVQPLENLENPLLVFRIDADAVIADGKEPRILLERRGNMNQWRLLPAKFDGVADQVLKKLQQLRGVPLNGRQVVASDRRTGFLDGGLQIGRRLLHDFAASDGRQRPARMEPSIGSHESLGSRCQITA